MAGKLFDHKFRSLKVTTEKSTRVKIMSDKSAIDSLFGSNEPSKFLTRYTTSEIVDLEPEIDDDDFTSNKAAQTNDSSTANSKKKKTFEKKAKSEVDETERIQRTLFLGNLPVKVTTSQITTLVGKKFVESVRLRSIALSDKQALKRQVAVRRGLVNDEGTCCAYVVMKTPKDVTDAIEKFNKTQFMEHTIRADRATPQGEKNKPDRETNKKSVFIGHLPYDATEEELIGIFKECGEIHHVRIPRDDRGKSRGVAFVTFENEEDVSLALQFNNSQFRKEKITVERSNPGHAEKVKRKKEEKAEKAKGNKLTKAEKPKGKFGNRKKQIQPRAPSPAGKDSRYKKGGERKSKDAANSSTTKTAPKSQFEGRKSKPQFDEKNQHIKTYLKMRAHITKKRKQSTGKK